MSLWGRVDTDVLKLSLQGSLEDVSMSLTAGAETVFGPNWGASRCVCHVGMLQLLFLVSNLLEQAGLLPEAANMRWTGLRDGWLGKWAVRFVIPLVVIS